MSNSKGAPSNLSSATRELLAQVAREGSLDGLMAALGSQSEKDQLHMAYCTWLIAQKSRNDLTAPIRDLVNFLDRASSEGVVAKIYFPGSSTVRKFKK